jgi:glycosyltransferase involved in cell wall biosynthesis
MSIVIFGDVFSFPDGQAATNRVYTYAKGFKENGIKVHVVVFSSLYHDKHNGITDGIYYYHPFQQKTRSNSFLVRRWQNLLKYFRTYRLLKRINREDKIIAINRWTTLLSTHLMGWLLSKFFRTKLILECSEHPFRFYHHGAWKKMQGAAKFYIESHLCDGILCISRYLVDFHRKHGISQKKLFLVPSTVDPCRFIRTGGKPIPGEYIGYFGSLTFKRDNVDLLINAFARFSNGHPQIQLVLGGFCSQYERTQIVKLIDQLNITAKVKIVDFLTREEILRYITHADLLVMTRSQDFESDASYPSKLTEFLATGKPVVTVNVGEISDFLKDNENAFLVQPGNVQALADKLEFVFNNYELALQVAQRGQELTHTTFNYYYQSKRIIDFISALNNHKKN